MLAARFTFARPYLGFEPEVDRMLAVADNQRVTEPYWEGYWNFLWGTDIQTINIPLTATYDQNRIHDYLQTEISPRYDAPASPPKPIPGTSQFAEGVITGSSIDIDRATLQIIDALRSPTNRRINLSHWIKPPSPGRHWTTLRS
jgi:beta-lactamase class A